MIANSVENVAIIAGQGVFPKVLYDECVKKKINCKVIALKGEFDPYLFFGIEYKTFAPYELDSIFSYLKSIDCFNISIAGKVKRNNISKLILDKKGRIVLKEIIKSGFNDTSVYSTLINLIEKEGFKLVSPSVILESVIMKKGVITNVSPNEENMRDIQKGLEILRGIIKYDLGQGLIIHNGLVLGVEAAEGTNELLKRCSDIRDVKKGGILIKIFKPQQDSRLDLPCAGEDTIKNIAKYGYEGIVMEAEKSILLTDDKCVDFANKNNVFIYGV
jgi:DUF1009 family protein